MTRLTSIRRVLEEEHVYEVNDGISGSHIRLSILIKVNMLDDTLKMSIDKEGLEFQSQKYFDSKYEKHALRCVASTKVTPNLIAPVSDNRFWTNPVRTASVRCGLILGRHFVRFAAQVMSENVKIFGTNSGSPRALTISASK